MGKGAKSPMPRAAEEESITLFSIHPKQHGCDRGQKRPERETREDTTVTDSDQ